MAEIDRPMRTYGPKERWTFRDPDFGLVVPNARLSLWWVPEYTDLYVDNWSANETTARELFLRWRAERLGPTGLAVIRWAVRVERSAGQLNSVDTYAAPYMGDSSIFDDPRSVPVSELTGERVNWLRVPVANQVWSHDRREPGGIVQSALGWKPSPLQRTIDTSVLWHHATGRPLPEQVS